MGARPRNRWQWLVVFGAGLALGCSSSDSESPLPVSGDGGDSCRLRSCADAGPFDGGSTLPPPEAGTGGSSAGPTAGMTEPSVPTPMVPVCTPQVPLVPTCAGCACTTLPECAAALTECDDRCWALLGCGYEHCLTTFNAECLEESCPDQIDALEPALAAGNCVAHCYGFCLYDLQRYAMDDMDAGL